VSQPNIIFYFSSLVFTTMELSNELDPAVIIVTDDVEALGVSGSSDETVECDFTQALLALTTLGWFYASFNATL
jgi:hypothetical protein